MQHYPQGEKEKVHHPPKGGAKAQPSTKEGKVKHHHPNGGKESTTHSQGIKQHHHKKKKKQTAPHLSKKTVLFHPPFRVVCFLLVVGWCCSSASSFISRVYMCLCICIYTIILTCVFTERTPHTENENRKAATPKGVTRDQNGRHHESPPEWSRCFVTLAHRSVKQWKIEKKALLNQQGFKHGERSPVIQHQVAL